MAGIGGSGYQVNAGVNFESNGVAVMRDLAAAVKAASTTVDANTAAVMANARAVKLMATSIRDAVTALGAGTQALGNNTTAVDAVTAAYDRATAAVSRFNAGVLGAAAFAPQATARVIPNIPPVTRVMAGALGASAFATRYYSPSWGSEPLRLPPGRGGQVPAIYEPGPNWRRTEGPQTHGWEYGGYRGTGDPFPNRNAVMPFTGVPYDAQRTFGMGRGFQGVGGGPPGGGGGLGLGGMLPGAAGAVMRFGGPLGHLIEGGAIVDAVTEAARFQGVMQSIYNIVGATSPGSEQTQDRLRNTMYDVGNQYAMSPIQSANMFREIARQSQGAMPLASMEQMLPYIARMQVVLSQTRGFSPGETTDAAMNFVHLLRLYKPEQMGGEHGGFDLMTRLMELAPVDPQQLVRQMTYVAPIFKNLDIPNEQLAALMLTLTRSGYGTGKGATGIAQLVQQSLGVPQITSFSTAVKMGYLHQLGILGTHDIPGWADKPDTPGANVIQMLSTLAKSRETELKKTGHLYNFQRLMTTVYGQQGGRMGALFSDPVIGQVLAGTMETLKQPSLGLTEQSNAYLNLTTTRVNRAWQNLQAVMTEVGWITLPAVSKTFNDLGDVLHNAQAWLNSHKAETKAWSDGLVAAVKGIEREVTSVIPTFMRLGRILRDIVQGNWGDFATILGEKSKVSPDDMAKDNAAKVERLKWFFGLMGNNTAPWLKLGVPPHDTVAHPIAHGDSKRDAAIPPLQIIIQGYDKDKKALAEEVKRQLASFFSTPRSVQRSASESRTHPAIPSTLTKRTA